MFTTLPTARLCDILGSWIGVKSLVCLDSAYCNHTDRPVIRSLLSSEEFIVQSTVAFYKPKLIAWLVGKEVKVSGIVFGVVYAPELLSVYLRKWGSFISLVDIGPGQTTDEIHLVALYCKNLQIVLCENVTLGPELKELLFSNPNLSEIWLDRVSSSTATLFDDIPLTKLSTFSIQNTVCKYSFPLPTDAIKSTLQKLQLGTGVPTQIIVKIVYLSVALKSLSLKDVDLPNRTLIDICSMRPILLHLDVSNNQLLDSNDVRAVCKTLKQLRSINIRRCVNASDESIYSLTIHRGNTLEVVYMDIKNATDNNTIKRLYDFSCLCTKVRFLSCAPGVLCPAGGT